MKSQFVQQNKTCLTGDCTKMERGLSSCRYMKRSRPTMSTRRRPLVGPLFFHAGRGPARCAAINGSNSQPVKFVSDRPVALARLPLQAFPVLDAYLAARIIHQPILVQDSRGQGHGGTRRPQHVSQEFMRDGEGI